LSSSVATTTSGLASRIGSVETKTGSYATTGSNVFVGSQVITGSICSNGNIVTTGQIVAQTINVQQVTSSIVYSCGSNVFGTDINNTQQFTGSMLITGSNFRATVGTACFSGNVCASAFVGGTVSGNSGTFSGNLSLQGAVTRNINFYDDTCTNINAQIQYDQISSNSGQFLFKTNNAGTLGTKLTIANTGVATFACSVSANSLNINTSTVFAKANISDALTATSIGTNYNPGILNIQNSNTTNGNLSLIGFQDANAFINLAAVGAINDIHSASPNSVVGSLGFYTKASGGAYITEKMRINGDGNVGIGTCTPVGKLDVTLVNTRRFIVTYDDSIITIKGASDTGAGENLRIIGDNLIFNTNSVGSGTERMRITSTGISCFACQVCAPNLLISNCATIGTVGFSYPEFRLAVTPIMTVVGAGCASTSEGIYFKRVSNLCQGGWISGNGGALYIVGQNKHSTAFGDIYFATNNGTTTCDIMVIDGPNQRVGIGTTTPNTKLEVKGSIRLDSRSKVDTGEIDSITFTKDRPDASTGTYEMGSIRSFTYGGYAGGLTFYSGRHTGNGNYGLIPIMTIGSTSDIGTTNMGIGTTSPNSKLEVQKTGAGAAAIFINQCSSDEATIRFKSTHSAMSDFRIGASILVGNAFEIYNVQCNRTNYMVNCLGFSKISNDGTFVNGSNTNYHSMNSSGDVILYAYQTGPGSGILTNVQACNNSIYSFRGYSDPYGDMAFIYSNGTFGSRTGTYGGIVSDARCKTEICDASSQWSDIKNLRVRNFKLIEDVENDPINAMRQIGFIAQEVETVSPGLVFESGNGCVDSGCWKNVKTSIIHTKAVKALQEAMCRIEILESCLGIN
jgi:hypothetical protein